MKAAQIILAFVVFVAGIVILVEDQKIRSLERQVAELRRGRSEDHQIARSTIDNITRLTGVVSDIVGVLEKEK